MPLLIPNCAGFFWIEGSRMLPNYVTVPPPLKQNSAFQGAIVAVSLVKPGLL
jgi:hypothetical protein